MKKILIIIIAFLGFFALSCENPNEVNINDGIVSNNNVVISKDNYTLFNPNYGIHIDLSGNITDSCVNLLTDDINTIVDSGCIDCISISLSNVKSYQSEDYSMYWLLYGYQLLERCNYIAIYDPNNLVYKRDDWIKLNSDLTTEEINEIIIAKMAKHMACRTP